MNHFKVVGFDADDTLWVNEDYYRETEKKFTGLMSEYGPEKEIMDELFSTEMKNLELFGYGIKPFMISMIEAAIRISAGSVGPGTIERIIEMGKEMIEKEIELLPGVKEVIHSLYGRYKLILVTKGDLLDQERKLKRSSLSECFHHIEIMSDKTIESYRELLHHLEIEPGEFVMIGNSLRSDIIPPFELGCSVVYVPYVHTWQHEMNVEEPAENARFHKIKSIKEVLELLK